MGVLTRDVFDSNKGRDGKKRFCLFGWLFVLYDKSNEGLGEKE